MAVGKKLRFEVFKRDLFTCQYCGKRPPDVVLEVDHVQAKCNGGSDEMDNLTTSCWDCNRGKAGNDLGKVAPGVDEMARLAAIQEMAERSRLLAQEHHAARQAGEMVNNTIDAVFSWWNDELDEADAFQDLSIKLFLKRGLTVADFRDAVDSTAAKRARRWMDGPTAWRYFCGVCWKMIRDREGVE